MIVSVEVRKQNRPALEGPAYPLLTTIAVIPYWMTIIWLICDKFPVPFNK